MSKADVIEVEGVVLENCQMPCLRLNLKISMWFWLISAVNCACILSVSCRVTR